MNPTHLPRLHLLKHSQLGQDSYQSLFIALLRGVAALQVAAAHLRADFFPGLSTLVAPTLWYQALAFFTGFAHQAVLAFFLISGWLVGGSLLDKLGQSEALTVYAIDRITRLWTVLIPTLLLILILGMLTGIVNPLSADVSSASEYSLLSFVGNLFGLQTITLPRFGGNYPLWSLANESWYYLLFPLLLMFLTASRWHGRVFCGMCLILAALALPFPLLLYFSLWLLGAAFSRIRIDCGSLTRLALLLALTALSVLFRLHGSNGDLVPQAYAQDLVLSLLLLLVLSSMQIKVDPQDLRMAQLRKGANFFAGFSFTLYVVHVPVLGMLAWLGSGGSGKLMLAPDNLAHLALYFALLTIVLAFSYGFSRLFEAHTGTVRRHVKNALLRPHGIVARTAPAKH